VEVGGSSQFSVLGSQFRGEEFPVVSQIAVKREKRSSCARTFGFAQGKLAGGGCPHIALLENWELRTEN